MSRRLKSLVIAVCIVIMYLNVVRIAPNNEIAAVFISLIVLGVVGYLLLPSSRTGKLFLIGFIIPSLLSGQIRFPLDVTVYKTPATTSGIRTCSQQRIWIHYGKKLWGFETKEDTLMLSQVRVLQPKKEDPYYNNPNVKRVERKDTVTGQHYEVMYVEDKDGLSWYISPVLKPRVTPELFSFTITSDKFCRLP